MTQRLTEKYERIETNLKYLVDLDLSDDETFKDPLALALYYHYIEKHNLQNINKAKLVSWARTYCYEKIIERQFSKKKDTELTAAILAYSTLKNDAGYPEEKKKKIEEGLKDLLKQEKGKDGLLFERPNFTAIIIYAINKTKIADAIEKDDTLNALLKRYKGRKAFNNLLGLPFLTQLLIALKKENLLQELIVKIKERLKDHLLDYDDRLYLVQSLWTYHSEKKTLSEVQSIAESTIEETPVMLSDIINKGDISDITVREDNRKISRLYKAMLLDLITDYKRHAVELKEQALDRRYASDFSLKWGAFTAFSLISALPAVILGFVLWSELQTGLSFWIMQQTETTWQELITNTSFLVLEAYLIVFGAVGIYSLFTSLIGKKIAKDLRVWENYKLHQKKALKWSIVSLLGAIILAIITKLAASAFHQFISPKG